MRLQLCSLEMKWWSACKGCRCQGQRGQGAPPPSRVTHTSRPGWRDRLSLKVKASENQILLSQKPNFSFQTPSAPPPRPAPRPPPARSACVFLCVRVQSSFFHFDLSGRSCLRSARPSAFDIKDLKVQSIKAARAEASAPPHHHHLRLVRL